MNQRSQKNPSAVSLREVAKYAGLTPGTVSIVLNNAPSARSIPQHTRDRIVAAARALNYRPNYIARALRSKRTYTVAVLVPDIGESSIASVVSGVEACLHRRNYCFFVASHRNDVAALDRWSDMFVQRGVEGTIVVNLDVPHSSELPAVPLDTASSLDFEPVDRRAYLRDQGESAAELLLTRIEGRDVEPMQTEVPQQLIA